MHQYFFTYRQRTALEKNVILVAITALLVLLGFGNTSSASIAIHGNRATAGYWTEKNPDGDKICLTQEEIASINQAMRKKTASVTDLITYPQAVGGAELKELILGAQQDFRGETEPGEHFDKGGSPITQYDYNAAQGNCNLDAVPVSSEVRYGVVTMRTDMRLLPTAKYYFDDKSFQHYDDLQGTALDPCEPLLVLHTSKDGAFAFAIGRYYMGWVSLGAIGFTDRATWEKYVSPKNFLVVTDHKKKVHVGGAWLEIVRTSGRFLSGCYSRGNQRPPFGSRCSHQGGQHSKSWLSSLHTKQFRAPVPEIPWGCLRLGRHGGEC